MRAFRIFGRNIRDSIKSVFRNFSLSLASISCIAITLVVVSLSVVLSFNVNNFTALIEQDVTIVTFLDVDIDDAGRKTVLENINSLDNIHEVAYSSKAEISEEMMESSEVFENIMKDWDEDESPIQDTYLVKVKDINTINATAEQINVIEGVSVVKYGEGMVEQLVSVFDMIRKAGYIATAALIIVTAFLITNTIKITIFSRRKEIEIMRLVGASNLNIKVPFVLEGLLLGLLGSIIPIIITVYGYNALFTNLGGIVFSPLIKLIDPVPFVFEISIILAVIGILVGMFGSLRAVRKHLKI